MHPTGSPSLPARAHAPSPLLRRLVAALGVLTLWLLCGFGPPRLTDSDAAPTVRILPGAAAPLALQEAAAALSATAALVYDQSSGQILFERNADWPLPPASLTKLLTALLLLESGNLDQVVTVRGADLVGNASMGLVAGEQITLGELLEGMLIPSGNDAATAIARTLGGTVEGFVERMNQRAAELGLTQSHFLTPNGLDREGQFASARDLLALALLDWRQPAFRAIVARSEAKVAGRTLQNTNELLGPLPSQPGVTVVGVKTGTTSAAGQCLIAALEENGRLTFVVVLGSSDRYRDVRSLYAAMSSRYRWHNARLADFGAINRLVTPDGHTRWLDVAAGEGAPAAMLAPWQIELLTPVRTLTRLDPQEWQQGAEVGFVEWRLGAQVLARQPLVIR